MAIGFQPTEAAEAARAHYRAVALERMRPLSRTYDEREHALPEEWAAYGNVEGEYGGLVSDEDLGDVARKLEPDSAAALLMWENTWAHRFVSALAEAGEIDGLGVVGRVVDVVGPGAHLRDLAGGAALELPVLEDREIDAAEAEPREVDGDPAIDGGRIGRVGEVRGVGEGQGLEGKLVLAAQAKRRPAGGKNHQMRARRQQRCKRRSGPQHLLAVVEHEQQAPVAQCGREEGRQRPRAIRDDAERLGEFVQGDDGRVPATALKAAEVLLAKTRTLFDLLLRQTLFPPEAGEVSSNQFAYIHAQTDRNLHTLSLSTIVCKLPFGKEPQGGHDGSTARFFFLSLGSPCIR